CGARLFAGAPMLEAMAGDFVARRADAAYNGGIAFRDPAEREERRVGICFGEKLEDSIDVALDAAWKRIPIASLDAIGERGDLKIILHVDRECVDDRRPVGSCVSIHAATLSVVEARAASQSCRS